MGAPRQTRVVRRYTLPTGDRAYSKNLPPNIATTGRRRARRHPSEADGSAGVDTVVTAFDIPALPSTIENLQMTGTRDVKAVLNDQTNQVTGNAGANRVESGGGDDTVPARPPMI